MSCPVTHLECLSFCCGPYRAGPGCLECRIGPPYDGVLADSDVRNLSVPWARFIPPEAKLLALTQLEQQHRLVVQPEATIREVRTLFFQEYLRREEVRPPPWEPPPPRRPKSATPRPTLTREQYLRRNLEIYRARLKGETFTALGKKYDLSPTAIACICNNMMRREKRHAAWWARKQRYPTNLGRPLDLAGPRDVWLSYGVSVDPRLDNMLPTTEDQLVKFTG